MATKGVKATQEAIDQLKGKLRAIDRLECVAFGHDPDKALQEGFERSELCFTASYNDRPVLAFGVRRESLLSDKGIPWMLATDDIKKLSRDVVMESKVYVAEFLKRFEYLENYVHVDNIISKRWLKWCGFTFDKPAPFGLNGEIFQRFWIRRT